MWLVIALAAHAATTTKAPPPSGPACSAPLVKALTDAGPAATAKAFSDLAACDPGAAHTAAADAFKRLLPGGTGDAAVVAAISVGSGDVVRTWVGGLEPDDRSATISKLGQACGSPGVPTFFLDTSKTLGEKFWEDRWYRGLGECREASVQQLLRDRLDHPSSDHIALHGVLEVFSRNLGKDAIPALKASVQSEKDPELASYKIEAFADAAGVGREGGADAEATRLAIAAINELAPGLPDKAVEQARTTLLSLGAEADSDKLAAVRYKSALQGNGGLLYGVVTTEVATCKKGDTRVVFHHALINEAGHTWPDQVAERIAPAVTAGFKLDLATSCKGTGKIASVTPAEPFKDAAAANAWVESQLREVEKQNAGVKPRLADEAALTL